MRLPTVDEVYDRVDQAYLAENPGAPAPLDPEDPAHAQWMDAWRQVRDRLVNDLTDEAFAQFFPGVGRLEPDNSEHLPLIEYWRDIRDQIRDGQPGRFDWENNPPMAPGSDGASNGGSGAAGIVDPLHVERLGDDSFILTFPHGVNIEEAWAWLWQGDPASGATIDQAAFRIDDLDYEIRGIDHEASLLLRPTAYEQLSIADISSWREKQNNDDAEAAEKAQWEQFGKFKPISVLGGASYNDVESNWDQWQGAHEINGNFVWLGLGNGIDLEFMAIPTDPGFEGRMRHYLFEKKLSISAARAADREDWNFEITRVALWMYANR